MVSSAVWLEKSVACRGSTRAQHARGNVDVASGRLARALGRVANSTNAANRRSDTTRLKAQLGHRRNPVFARRQPSRAGRRSHSHTGGTRALVAALARPGPRICYNRSSGERARTLNMDERAFYTEKEETRKVKLVCPSCRGEFEAPVRWKVCRKRKELPRGVGEEDRRKFAKATSYMVRLDDLVACYKCRKRFELTGQSTVLINDNLGDPNADPENFGNR